MGIIWLMMVNNNLVGGIPAPLKNMKVSWDDEIPQIWKNKNVWNHKPDDYKWSLEWENPLTLINGHFICFLHHLDIPKAAKRASGLPASASDSSAWPAVHLPVYM